MLGLRVSLLLLTGSPGCELGLESLKDFILESFYSLTLTLTSKSSLKSAKGANFDWDAWVCT